MLYHVTIGSRTFAVELSGNAADPVVNPERTGQRDIPQVLRVRFANDGQETET